MNIFEFLNSEKASLAIAGIAGAAVSAVMEWEGVMPALRRIFVGAVTAWFLGPIGIPLFMWASKVTSLPTEHTLSVGGFLVGIGGMFIVEFIMRVWKIRIRQVGKDDT
ncbi:hypothetical protein [Rhizobium sp. Root149]|uniref:hypothetical protein n=1 Tax=Rhizobium sp. Root149 TaxID=1736473 RepID=UPI0012E34B90|nr:hypothetical protein [Rhizobium sp. Root149]